MKLTEFYKKLYEVEAPAPVDPVKPSDEKPTKGVSDKFKDQLKKGYLDFGCKYFFTVKGNKESKLSELRKKGTNPKWQVLLLQDIAFVDAQIIEKDCNTSTEPEKPEKPEKPTTDITPTKEPQVVYTEPTKTKSVEKTTPSVKQSYETPKVLPEPVYDSESEITNIQDIQSDDLIDNAIIDLDNQISLQEPEIQEKLKELNITSDRMAYLLPLTRETKDFMMNMQMQGINLPHLMLMYNNIKTLYSAIEQGNNIERNNVLPLNKMINYNQFWDWSRQLWDNSNSWLKSNFIGTYPELDRSTLLP